MVVVIKACVEHGALFALSHAIEKQKGPDFHRSPGDLRKIVQTTNTICQNPFAALSAGAKSG
jgi:hypothetical protein